FRSIVAWTLRAGSWTLLRPPSEASGLHRISGALDGACPSRSIRLSTSADTRDRCSHPVGEKRLAVLRSRPSQLGCIDRTINGAPMPYASSLAELPLPS